MILSHVRLPIPPHRHIIYATVMQLHPTIINVDSAVRGRRLNRLTNEPFATLLSYTTFKQNASLFLNFFKKIYFSNFKDFLTAECLSILCHPTPCVNVSYIKYI